MAPRRTRMAMTDQTAPSGSNGVGAMLSREAERALVRCAFSAGWHMAGLYIAATSDATRCARASAAGWATNAMTDGPPRELSGATVLGPLDRAHMVTERIATALAALDGRL